MWARLRFVLGQQRDSLFWLRLALYGAPAVSASVSLEQPPNPSSTANRMPRRRSAGRTSPANTRGAVDRAAGDRYQPRRAVECEISQGVILVNVEHLLRCCGWIPWHRYSVCGLDDQKVLLSYPCQLWLGDTTRCSSRLSRSRNTSSHSPPVCTNSARQTFASWHQRRRTVCSASRPVLAGAKSYQPCRPLCAGAE